MKTFVLMMMNFVLKVMNFVFYTEDDERAGVQVISFLFRFTFTFNLGLLA